MIDKRKTYRVKGIVLEQSDEIVEVWLHSYSEAEKSKTRERILCPGRPRSPKEPATNRT